MGPAGSGGADHQALDFAVLAEVLDGGHGADVIAVVDGVVIGLGVADDEGIGDLEPLKEETVAEEHVDALRAVGVELGLPGVLGAVVHEDGGGGEAFAQGHGILVDHGLDELFDEYNLGRLLFATRVLPYINKEASLNTTETNPYYK